MKNVLFNHNEECVVINVSPDPEPQSINSTPAIQNHMTVLNPAGFHDFSVEPLRQTTQNRGNLLVNAQSLDLISVGYSQTRAE